MPNVAQLETFAAGAETAVDVAQIERQLGELWRLAAESEKDPTRRAITRACLFNLVVFCETETSRDEATATIRTLTSRHPCRAIVLLAQPSLPQSELSASITAHCHLAAGGGKQVCCEQISIVASGASVEHLATAVLPLLESDLPTLVWWRGNFLLQARELTRLGAVADRILFDTSLWSKPEQYLAPLVETIRAMRRCNFGDLSWTRLGLWRKLAAESFDEPHCRAALEDLERVEVTHGRGPGAGLRALLYASWVAAQLGWQPREAAQRIKLTALDDTDATSVGILSITLRSAQGSVNIRKNYGEATASVTVSMTGVCELPRKRAFWPTDDASLISQELDHNAPHVVYERTLAMAAALVAQSVRVT